MTFAPIALFIYNRPAHTRRTLESLRTCPELASSPLHIFCDGPKRPRDHAGVVAARQVARELAPQAAFIEREHNVGLARSIDEGVTALTSEYGTAIAVEDDLEVGPAFLRFLNAGLARYADDDRVMQISAFQYPLSPPPNRPVFFSFITSWGWATWRRAWQHFDPNATGYSGLRADRERRRAFDLDDAYPYFAMLENQLRGELDSWAIRWYLSIFSRDGLALFPPRSLVKNIGNDASGTHAARGESYGEVATADDPSTDLPGVELDLADQQRAFDVIRRANPRSPVTRAMQAVHVWSLRLLDNPRTPAPLRSAGKRALGLAHAWRRRLQ